MPGASPPSDASAPDPTASAASAPVVPDVSRSRNERSRRPDLRGNGVRRRLPVRGGRRANRELATDDQGARPAAFPRRPGEGLLRGPHRTTGVRCMSVRLSAPAPAFKRPCVAAGAVRGAELRGCRPGCIPAALTGAAAAIADSFHAPHLPSLRFSLPRLDGLVESPKRGSTGPFLFRGRPMRAVGGPGERRARREAQGRPRSHAPRSHAGSGVRRAHPDSTHQPGRRPADSA